MEMQQENTSSSGPGLPDAFMHQDRDYRIVLSHFFDIMFPMAAVLGGMALAVSLAWSFSSGWLGTALLHIAAYGISMAALVNRRRFSPVHLFMLMLVIMFITAVHSLCTMGLAGEGLLLMLVMGVFSGLFLKRTPAVIISVVGTISAATVGGMVCTGAIRLAPDTADHLYNPTTWGGMVFLVLLFVIPLVFVVNYMQSRNREAVENLQQLNKQLAEEIAFRTYIEQELRKSQAKYRNIFENSTEGLFQFSTDGDITIANPSLVRMFGLSSVADLLTGLEKHKDVCFVENSERDCLRKVIMEKGSAEGFETRMFRKDKSTIWVSINARRVDRDGQTFIEGTILDITRRKSLEAKLMQSEKMEAIGTFAGGIVHDFNNILTVMSGCGTLLKTRMTEEDPLVRYVDQILAATGKAAEMTQHLLTFSRRQPVVARPLDLNEAVEGMDQILRRLLTRHIVLKTALSGESLLMMGDKTQIDQILFNLISNAKDAMPDGGVITLKTEFIELEAAFIREYGFGKKGQYVAIILQDTGIGMDEKTLQCIFDPFFTTKPEGKGTGLGLSTVYGIVKQFNGYIVAKSRKGEGTCFRIYFPAVTSDMMRRFVANQPKPLPLKTAGRPSING